MIRNKIALPAVLAKFIFSKPMLSIQFYMDEKTTPMLSCNQILTIVPDSSPQGVQNSSIIINFYVKLKNSQAGLTAARLYSRVNNSFARTCICYLLPPQTYYAIMSMAAMKMNFTLSYCKIFAYLFQAGCLYRHNRSNLTCKMIGISVMSNVIRLNCGTTNIKSGDQRGYHSAYIIQSWLT